MFCKTMNLFKIGDTEGGGVQRGADSAIAQLAAAIQKREVLFHWRSWRGGGGFTGLATTAASPQFTTEIYNSVQKHVVRNWDGPDAKAFAGIYKSNKVCSA